MFVCVGVVLDFPNSYFSSLCVWVYALKIFCVCMCGSVVWNLLVTIFPIIFIYLSIYLSICVCMFPAWCFLQRTCLAQGLVNGIFNETNLCFLFKWFLLIFFFNAGPSLFLECDSLSLLYPSFTFDIWYVVCVCVSVSVRVVSDFTYSDFFSVCECVNWDFIYIRGSLNKFPDFFRMGTFINSTHMKLYSPSK